MTIHRDMFDNKDEGRCELCGSTEVCKPCAGPQAQDDGDLSIFDRTSESTIEYFKCEQCGCVCETTFMSVAYPELCLQCESMVFEHYGATGESEE